MSSEDLYNSSPRAIVFYGKTWCPDCHRARKVLVENKTDFLEVDISKDKKAGEYVRQINRGNESVPTIIFPDGTILVEPGNSVLRDKLRQLEGHPAS